MRGGARLTGPPLGRHAAALGLTIALMVVFVWTDTGLGRWNALPLPHTVFADVSLVLLCLILALGGGARVIPRLRPLTPWGRELGISMFVTASLHVAILIGPDLEIRDLFGIDAPDGFEFGTGMWHAANWVGVVALGYALVLAAISNDWAHRRLGRGWKFLQRQAYTLFVLTWLHVAAFVLLDAGHGAVLGPWTFWPVTTLAVLFQLAGFAHTVVSPRGPTPQRPVQRLDGAGRSRRSGLLRWSAAVAMWFAFVSGSWFLSQVQSDEERQIARVCDRFDELRDRSPVEREEILVAMLDGALDLGEVLEVCLSR